MADKLYILFDQSGKVTGSNYFAEGEQPELSTDMLPTISSENLYFNSETGTYYDGTTVEELGNRLALHVLYPELAVLPYKLIQLDNLEGIKRDSTLADKGLKGEKKYKKDGQLVWSSEKKYWFQEDGYADGFRRITKLYKMNGEVADSWEIFYELSDDDKEFFKKQQRELIFEYFKSQQPELFNLLYSFFKEEIDRYVMKDGPELAATLTDAATNHPVQLVRDTLSTVVPTQSGGTVSVLQGVLAELV
jgi:hypothetical protein